MYNFLDLPPTGQRYIYQVTLQFDLATNLLCKHLATSIITEVRQDMFLEGFRRVRNLTEAHGEGIIAQHLVAAHGREFLELNPDTQFFVSQYEHSVEATKSWLTEVMEVPLWVVRSEVEEQVMRCAAMRTEDEIAKYFADRCNGRTRPLTLEAIAA